MSIESNKIIAEFMGFTYEKNIGWYDNDMLMSQNVYDNQDGNCFDELLFDKSWDWLMPVVEKCLIGEAEREDFIYQEIYEGLTNISLSQTYKAVIEFIKNYNKDE